MIGVLATQTALVGLGVQPGAVSLAWAMAAQLVFTIGERPIWRGSRYSFIGFLFIAVDAWFNFGGVWPFVKNIDKTPQWAASVEAMNMAATPSSAISAVASILVSIGIASATEWLWYMED